MTSAGLCSIGFTCGLACEKFSEPDLSGSKAFPHIDKPIKKPIDRNMSIYIYIYNFVI